MCIPPHEDPRILCHRHLGELDKTAGRFVQWPGDLIRQVHLPESISAENYGQGAERMTWIEEDCAQPLLRRRVLDHRETRIAGGAVMIVHRNLEVSALEAGIRRINSKALAASPRNLKGTQGD